MISTYYGDEIRKVKTGGRKRYPCFSSGLESKCNRVDMKDLVLHAYLLERKKMTKWYIRMFSRLLNATILNSMVSAEQWSLSFWLSYQ
jgi:hypothetical protein